MAEPSFRDSVARELQNAGITRAAVDAIWPEWWSADAEQSISATTEVRYTIARRLGISPSSLMGGSPEFVWRDDAKFKNLGDTTEAERAVVTSFGVSVGRALLTAAPSARHRPGTTALAIRSALLTSESSISLREILRACWDLGIPVIKSNLSPLSRKAMQAMSVSFAGRYAIVVSRDMRYPAWVAFVIAHELGHIFNGHVDQAAALLEMDDPLRISDPDSEERQADRFALALLTGTEEFPITAAIESYNSAELRDALLREAPRLRVDPGVLALCLAHNTGRWPQSFKALQSIPDQYLDADVGVAVNWMASEELQWDRLSDERASYLRTVMGPIDGR